MNLKELKMHIKGKSLNDSLLVFKYEDNKWLMNSYIEAIANLKHKEILYINDLDNYYEDSNYLLVLELKELDKETYDNYITKYKNLIVVAGKIEKEIEYINFPKLEDWQIIDFISLNLPGLNNTEVKELFELSKENIYLVNNEINKLKLFNKAEQSDMFKLLKESDNYNNANDFTKFTFINYMVKKELNKIDGFLYRASNFEPMALVGILLKQFKNIIKVQMSSKNTPMEKLGMDFKQYKMNQRLVNIYSNEKLVDIYEFLTDIDYRLKSGLLEMDNTVLFDYIVCNVL